MCEIRAACAWGAMIALVFRRFAANTFANLAGSNLRPLPLTAAAPVLTQLLFAELSLALIIQLLALLLKYLGVL